MMPLRINWEVSTPARTNEAWPSAASSSSSLTGSPSSCLAIPSASMIYNLHTSKASRVDLGYFTNCRLLPPRREQGTIDMTRAFDINMHSKMFMKKLNGNDRGKGPLCHLPPPSCFQIHPADCQCQLGQQQCQFYVHYEEWGQVRGNSFGHCLLLSF